MEHEGSSELREGNLFFDLNQILLCKAVINNKTVMDVLNYITCIAAHGVVGDSSEVVTNIAVREKIMAALNDLTPSMRKVLELKYGLINSDPKVINEIVAEIGGTPEAVKVLEEFALRALYQGRVNKGFNCKSNNNK